MCYFLEWEPQYSIMYTTHLADRLRAIEECAAAASLRLAQLLRTPPQPPFVDLHESSGDGLGREWPDIH